MFNVKDVIDDDDEACDDEDKEDMVKAVKNTNKLEERDAVLRGTRQTSHSDVTLTVSSHTVDVKNNVEKGST